MYSLSRKAIFIIGLYKVCKVTGTSLIDMYHQSYGYSLKPAYKNLYDYYATPKDSKEEVKEK